MNRALQDTISLKDTVWCLGPIDWLSYYAKVRSPELTNIFCLTPVYRGLYNIICALGDRLVVGRRVLAPSARVRVLLPQPNEKWEMGS